MSDTATGAMVLGFIGLVLVGGGLSVVNTLHVEEKTCTVEDTYEARKSDSTSYRVETSECGVVEVQDTWLRMKFDAADRYAEIEEGKQHEMKLVGYRIPFFSMFPNAVEIEVK